VVVVTVTVVAVMVMTVVAVALMVVGLLPAAHAAHHSRLPLPSHSFRMEAPAIPFVNMNVFPRKEGGRKEGRKEEGRRRKAKGEGRKLKEGEGRKEGR
jgi:hypothetical protein